jgi:hypothetical protein
MFEMPFVPKVESASVELVPVWLSAAKPTPPLSVTPSSLRDIPLRQLSRPYFALPLMALFWL